MGLSVAVVDAQNPGNVGTIARAMKNFGLTDLYLVDPPDLDRDGEAYGFAGHAREDVLPNAESVSFEFLVENFHTVGFTAVTNEDARSHVRFPFTTPENLAEELSLVEADTCLVFGRENHGLSNAELAQLDQVAAIPASGKYPVLNLGQAATITLYELRDLTVEETQLPDQGRERADESQIERLYDTFAALLDASNHPEPKREKTKRLARRVFGRAHLTGREAITLTGVFRRAGVLARRADEGSDERPADPEANPDDS